MFEIANAKFNLQVAQQVKNVLKFGLLMLEKNFKTLKTSVQLERGQLGSY